MSGRIGIKALKPWQLYFKGELTEEELLKADKNNLDAMGCYKTTCISSYDAAKECKEYIFEARGLWDVNKKFINHKELMPNVKQKSMREKSKMARILFKNIHRLAWNGKPFSRNIESYRPLTSTLLPSGLNIFIRDESDFLKNAQMLIEKETNLHEIFALFAIFEAWILWIKLFKDTDNLEKEKYFRNQRSYIFELLHASKKERERKLLEIGNRKGLTLRNLQAQRGKLSVEAKRRKAKKRNEDWVKDANTICKRIFATPRAWNKINYNYVSDEIIQLRKLDRKKKRSIVEAIRVEVKNWKEKVMEAINENQKNMGDLERRR